MPKGPPPSPLDAPMSFQADVQEFQILCRRLGLKFVCQPTRADAPPDTAIVTNQEILAMQAAAQQVLETMIVLGPFSWDGQVLAYSTMGVSLFQPAGNVVDAILALAGPVKETPAVESEEATCNHQDDDLCAYEDSFISCPKCGRKRVWGGGWEKELVAETEGVKKGGGGWQV